MLLRVRDLDLWVESTPGSAGSTPVLLVSGADSPCSHWPPALVDDLVAAGYRVVRFDQRDVGRSSAVESVYGLDDLVGDAVGVLDALEIDRAHVVGSSMGGMVGQKLAISHPDRLAALVVIISSPDPHRVWLSGPDPAWEEAVAALVLAPPARSDEELADRSVEMARLYAGTRYPFTAEAKRDRALAELSEGWPQESGHGLAMGQTEPWLDRLGAVTAPTLVVHGDSDPLFAVDHAESLVEAIAGARLLLFEGLGHEVAPGLVAEMMPAMLEHLEVPS